MSSINSYSAIYIIYNDIKAEANINVNLPHLFRPSPPKSEMDARRNMANVNTINNEIRLKIFRNNKPSDRAHV